MMVASDSEAAHLPQLAVSHQFPTKLLDSVVPEEGARQDGVPYRTNRVIVPSLAATAFKRPHEFFIRHGIQHQTQTL
ncbi:MAG: hypothetical protein BSOLF_1965 [Candidatus Carbobacillus altaicus]|uniref:Uncharacterized protein n=1 Tax=Candidatus Carbonibacillus altaicus TaxID=2163959 RepID=A0A2R6XYI8_9BACL|nr:MAG: hypothetical protein BSOLF_1965 [Candidatus Carbobacillus altaicus]